MTNHTYTIEKNNGINENTFFNDIFATIATPTYGTTDYSEALDNLILTSVTDKNPYMKELNITPETKSHCKLYTLLFGKKKTAKKATKITTLLEAINYLAHNYPSKDFDDDYIKIELPDGTILRIFDDEIQINNTLLSLDDSAALMKAIAPKKQKIIIDFAMKIAA